MLSSQAVVLCALLARSWAIDPSFPPHFKFGAATAAYQIEGGWNADGKGESIWDRFIHEHPEAIKGGTTADVAADSYHRWREDVKAVVSTKLQFYRFSISWPRILPTGFPNEINQAGVKYYSDLIDTLLAMGIEPVVTLYHWDLPVNLQDLGGWTNPLIVKWFGDYARVIYTLYANRVKTWLTINEPIMVCDFVYNSGLLAPNIKEPIYGPYLCNKHLMLAHAKAYRIFHHEFRRKYPGKISLANNVLWIEPFSANDTELAELSREYQTGRYSHQIFSKEGGWPPAFEKHMLKYSIKHGYRESRLPAFTESEIEFMKGTADFYGINYYTTNLVRPAKPGEEHSPWFFTGPLNVDAILEFPADAYYGEARTLPAVPKGLRRAMAWLKEQYGDIKFLITENGFSTNDVDDKLADYERVKFMKEHLEQVLLSIKVDGVDVIGYGAWSLIDNFEWLGGYTTRFGLFEIDYEDPNRKRTPRASALYYRCLIEKRSLDVPDSCFKKNYPVRSRTKRTHDVVKPPSNNGCILRKWGLFSNVIVLALGSIVSR